MDSYVQEKGTEVDTTPSLALYTVTIQIIRSLITATDASITNLTVEIIEKLFISRLQKFNIIKDVK